jgi:hypothetical protein
MKSSSLSVAAIIVLSVSAVIFAAMLGQIDFMLNTSSKFTSGMTWYLPFPFEFNKPIPALLAWEQIYVLMVVSFLAAAIMAFLFGASRRRK